MREAPRARYARNGDVNIAYIVVGDGPVDLLFVTGWASNLDFIWELPPARSFFSALAGFSRLISYDKRGTGLSDAIDAAGSFVDRVDDLRAVLDAAGAERPVICGLSEGGIVAAHFAAAEPERVRSLILLNAPAHGEFMDDHPEWDEEVRNGWGEGALFDVFLPEIPESPAARAQWARTQRQSASRGLAVQYYERMRGLDARPAFPAISAPTLVLRGTLDKLIPGHHAAETAGAIPGAILQDVPCGHIPWIVGGDEVAAAIRSFVTGAPAQVPVRRRLATILFTDIVDSTARAAASGDREWRALLDRHDAAVREQLERHGGREVKTTGDGFLAAFDGPAEAIDCALGARDAAAEMGVTTRAGIHTGQCEVRGDDLAGIAVHIGARVASLAGPGEVLVSRTVRDLVAGSDVQLEDRGEHTLKGVPEPWRVYAVT